MAKVHYAQNTVNRTCKGGFKEKTYSLKEVTCKKCLKRMFKVQPDGISFSNIERRLNEI